MTVEEFTNRYHYNPSEDKLGAGGFGQVYKAYDTALDKEVAIKMAQVIDGKENLSLMKEVELAKKLPVHANVAHYEDCFRLDFPNGTYDIGVLQYYSEGSLATIIKKGKFKKDQLEDLVRGILTGLEFLHQNNVMHRDMKPGNVLISKRGEQYIPKIADFGLSRQVESFEQSSFVNSFAGGSAYYAAPEQLAGEKVRQNVDLWSFGVMLYELVTGDRPFTATAAKSETEDARQEIYMKIKQGAIPSQISVIAEPYQTIIRSCLVPDRTIRVQRAEDVLSMLDGNTPVSFDLEATVIEQNSPAAGTDLKGDKSEKSFARSSATSVNPKKKVSTESSNKKQKSLAMPLAIGAAVLVGGCGAYFAMSNIGGTAMTDFEYWETAVSLNTSEIYEDYLTAFPVGEHKETAQHKLDSLNNLNMLSSWTVAEATNSIEGFQSFINEHSESEQATLATNKIEKLEAALSKDDKAKHAKEKADEDKAWKNAERDNTVNGFQKYLDVYPEGRYVANATQSIAQLELSPPELDEIVVDPNDVEETIIETTETDFDDTPNLYNESAGKNELREGLKEYRKANGNNSKAFGLFDQAVKLGNKEALLHRGWLYKGGYGVDKNVSQAEKDFNDAITSGYVLGHFGLFDIGKGRHHFDKALPELEKMVEKGDVSWAPRLAYEYYNGENINYTKARQIWERTGANGSANSLHNLGAIYSEGKGVSKDISKAFEYYLKAAELNYAGSINTVASYYRDGSGVPKNISEAVKWYRKGAKQGDLNCTSNLADLYYFDKYGVQDYSEALYWYKKAAEKGSIGSTRQIGHMYDYGKGVDVDWSQAAIFYKKSADKGDAYAQNQMGDFYLFGVGGMAKDKSKALSYYRKSAEQGNKYSKLALEVVPQIGKQKEFSGSNSYGDKVTIETLLDEAFTFSKGFWSWKDKATWTFGSSSQMRIWAAGGAAVGLDKNYEDELSKDFYNSSELYTEDGELKTGFGCYEKNGKHRSVGYLYYTVSFDKESVVIKIPSAFCWGANE